MTDIKDILQSLNLDLSNPEVVKGASEAIMEILSGRAGGGNNPVKDRLNGKAKRPEDDDSAQVDLGEIEQEIDPNLIQPPMRQPQGADDIETEIDDEDDVLNQIKQLGDDQQNQQNNDSGENEENQQGSQQQQSNQQQQNNQQQNDSQSTDQESDTQNGQQDQNAQQGDPNQQDDKDSDQSTNSDTDTEDGSGDKKASDNNSGSDSEGEDTDNTQGSTGDSEDETDEEEDEKELSDSDFGSKLAGENPKNEAQRIQINRTLKAAKNAVDKAEDAGQSGVTSILESCIESLEEMLEELENDPTAEITEEEMKQTVQRTLDAISSLDQKDLVFKSQEDRDQQVKKISDVMSDTGTAAELSAEDVEQIRADKQAIINNKREIDKYASRSRSSFKGFEDFVVSLRKALAMQVESEKAKVGSWTAINRRHDGTDVIKPGIKYRDIPNARVPVIDFYFDCSGSWTDKDLLKGDEALSKLAQLEKDGEIKINIFYFANTVHNTPEPARSEGGTYAWNHIIDNIVLTRATNVVIMTDSDMEYWCSNPPHKGYKVSGFVWFLWKNGDNAPNLPRLLQGRCGTMQYSFSSN